MRVVRPLGPGAHDASADGTARFDCGSAYDVLFMLAAAPHPRRHELARGWGAALQRRLSPPARVTWRALFGGEGAIGAEPVRLISRLPPFATAAQLVALLRALPPAEFALAFHGGAAEAPAVAEAITSRARGQAPTPMAQQALDADLAARKPTAAAQLRYLLADVPAVRQAYTDLLDEADRQALAPQWPELEPLLEATRASYARRYTGVGVPALVETLTGQPADPELLATSPSLVVALSYYIYPFALLLRPAQGLLLVVGTRGQEVAQHADPGAIRVLKAMADATRLRILELLAERPRYVQELADVLDVRHPTVVHHLAQLGQAGLVTSRNDGGTTFYTLDGRVFDDVVVHLRRRLRLDGS